MKIKLKYIRFCFFAIICIFIASCANQKPPGGGDEDKTAPIVTISEPKPNSINFKGNTLSFQFNEYVDRRSFQDAFRISPRVEGEINFNWSGKSVEVEFPKSLSSIKSNTTFVVMLNSNLTDIHGNTIEQPITFAFSTGNVIDTARIEGSILNDSGKVISILAYKLSGNNTLFDPSTKSADYYTETSSKNGSFILPNLAGGEYRLIAINDEDRNLLYTNEREDYGVLSKDITLYDSSKVKGINFFLKIINESEDNGVAGFIKDSANIVWSSVENNSRTVQPSQSIFLYFNRYQPNREDFVQSFKIKDESGETFKTVINWKSDSLVEIFPSANFGFAKTYDLSFNLKTGIDTTYPYKLRFKTISPNSYGEIKGSVIKNPEENSLPVIVNFTSRDLIPVVKYSYTVPDSVYDFKNIFEAEYIIFSFIDKNSNGVYDYGKPYPFEFSEPFYFYPIGLRVRGGWSIDNVILDLTK